VRVAYEGTALMGPPTGVGWYTEELIAAAAGRAPDDEFVIFPVAWRTSALVRAPRLPNVSVAQRLAPARPLWAAWRRLPVPRVEWFVGCDVFHAPNFVTPPSRRPVVVTIHDLNFVRRPSELGPDIRRLAADLPRFLRRADAIITISRFTADELGEWLPAVADRVTVIPIGPHRRSERAPTTGLLPGPPFALMLGNVQPRKNLPLALDALRIVLDRGVSMRLVVAGEVAPTVDVAGMLAARRLPSDAVVVTGYVDDARVAALLADAAVLVFPSLYEGFGMPLLEAMEAGVPVVALRAGATPETVDAAALLVSPGDVTAPAFAEAMIDVVSDSVLRAKLIATCRPRAAEFGWQRTADETLALYRRLAG
jgi:glycosyltransferase involved in cell wall biosynthesis